MFDSSHSRDSPMTKEEFYDFAKNRFIYVATEFTILSGSAELVFQNSLFEYFFEPKFNVIFEFRRKTNA